LPASDGIGGGLERLQLPPAFRHFSQIQYCDFDRSPGAFIIADLQIIGGVSGFHRDDAQTFDDHLALQIADRSGEARVDGHDRASILEAAASNSASARSSSSKHRLRPTGRLPSAT
jgi:hypothetical protein